MNFSVVIQVLFSSYVSTVGRAYENQLILIPLCLITL